jgi:hypothetical protein
MSIQGGHSDISQGSIAHEMLQQFNQHLFDESDSVENQILLTVGCVEWEGVFEGQFPSGGCEFEEFRFHSEESTEHRSDAISIAAGAAEPGSFV